MIRLAVLLSGRGSNFAAIYRAIAAGSLDAEVVLVVSNRSDAAGLAAARAWGLPAELIENRGLSRAAHEQLVVQRLATAQPDFVVLAGYMRLLSAEFVAAYRNRIVNIHPSVLPAFPGVDAQAQALAHGVKVSGCTVHFVDEGLDAGPILLQRTVTVLDSDTAETLSARILEQEHLAYPEALRILAGGRYRVVGRRVVTGNSEAELNHPG